MNKCSPEAIREFIIRRFAAQFQAAKIDPQTVADDFDLLVRGVVDSLGVMQLISEIEDEFKIEVDMEAMDVDQLTVVGPLCRYVAQAAKPRSEKT